MIKIRQEILKTINEFLRIKTVTIHSFIVVDPCNLLAKYCLVEITIYKYNNLVYMYM